MKNSLKQQFGARVRALRLDLNQSQEAFADQCDIARSYMSRIERGQANPALDMVDRLATGLRVTPADLFKEGTPVKSKSSPDLRPFAADGSWFDENFCRYPAGGYRAGEGGDERYFEEFEDALDHLRRMGTAKWRRPNAAGNFGRVSAVGWRPKP
ncbi:MAG: helix-turn-helix transcriptional regulator [Burkholderiaceae bacterium]|nr:helix-turn-helix transcriptional regulator [Polaromonas sp.]MDO8778183.1 helix-turn-helix transcriptional regulator [Burkholderiaceae bacterium]